MGFLHFLSNQQHLFFFFLLLTFVDGVPVTNVIWIVVVFKSLKVYVPVMTHSFRFLLFVKMSAVPCKSTASEKCGYKCCVSF